MHAQHFIAIAKQLLAQVAAEEPGPAGDEVHHPRLELMRHHVTFPLYVEVDHIFLGQAEHPTEAPLETLTAATPYFSRAVQTSQSFWQRLAFPMPWLDAIEPVAVGLVVALIPAPAEPLTLSGCRPAAQVLALTEKGRRELLGADGRDQTSAGRLPLRERLRAAADRAQQALR